jgi:DNA-binding PadR family transcriptional regulator
MFSERHERRGCHSDRHFGRFGRGRMHREFWMDWRGARARRGDIKFLILEVLAEGPRHGYDIIAELEKKSEGRYRPSPGSVYPTLQLLEDGGYVTGASVDGKRVYTITQSGRELFASKPADAAPGIDEDEGDGVDLRGSFMKFAAAAAQAGRSGDAAERTKIRDILDRARREIYAILAESK